MRLKYYGSLTVAALACAALAALWYLRTDIVWGYFFVILIGGLVGGVELLGRYLYAPLRAILSPSGAVYVLVNMAAAAAAYYMVGAHGFNIFEHQDKSAPTELDELKTTLLAGFGALAFMRSSLFKIRVGDNEIGIGPASILDTLLLVADRGVDRREAVVRALEVRAALGSADPENGARLLGAYCLALMQNVPLDKQTEIKESIKKIVDEQTGNAAIRLDLIALKLSNVVGSSVLEAAVQMFGDRGQLFVPKAEDLKSQFRSPQQTNATGMAAKAAEAATASGATQKVAAQPDRNAQPVAAGAAQPDAPGEIQA